MSLPGLVMLVPAVLSAQTSTPASAPDLRLPRAVAAADTAAVIQQGSPLMPIRQHVFTRNDAYLAAGFGLAAAVLFPLDQQFAAQLQSPAMQGNRSLDHAATSLEKITSPGAYYVGGALYLAGRLGGFDRVADLGLHATESVLLAEGIGFVLKRGIGRARPYVSGATDSRDFSLGSGVRTGDRRSLPSGHTYTAFAMASAITSEVHEWSPRATWVVAPLMYGGATMVGLSRMYHNQHWASDIALGAAIGTFSGLKLVRFMHRDRAGVDRGRSGAPLVSRDANGTQLGWRVDF